MVEARYLFGDCRELIRDLEDESIKMTVTSPPYNLNKDYLTYSDNIELDEWKNLIRDITKEIHRVLTPDGSFFLNVSPIPDKKTKEIIPLDSICWEIGKECGFYLRNKVIWHFNNMQNCTLRLSGRWEAVLWFVKDINNYVFNLQDIKIPCITKNDKRFNADAGRNPTDVWPIDMENDNFWYFDRVNNMTKKKLGIEAHPCIYPIPMIERIVKMSTNKNDWILDPFLGSGTTSVVAKKLERNSIGFELDVNYKPIIEKRLENEESQTIFI
ncbi:DNA-methyltransferase [Methanolobus psychrotolerans]|uniref:DNA-methyltransferase n=1 Tax=Methanolobus psychrotolerans TaxID=1874706 RepID=UPI001A915770|nr:site-specific DNA-methyltransferase [Methanolobus psychrotolerans]